MFLLAHLGVTAGVAYALGRAGRRPTGWDYRLVLVAAILPDLIDKPLALAGFAGGRSIAHTLLFLAVVTAIVAVPVRRGAAFGTCWALPLGIAVHLALDGMWQSPEVLLWPAYGFVFPPGGLDLASLWEAVLTNPVVQAGEVAGGTVLAGLAVRYRLYEPAAFVRFLRQGRLAVFSPLT